MPVIGGAEMPRYFFNVTDGENTELDAEGLEVPDHEAARSGALEALRELREEAGHQDGPDWERPRCR